MKKLSFLIAAVMLLSLLTACGGTPAGDGFDWPENPRVEQKNDSLKIYAMDVGKGPQMLELAAKLYQSRYPDVEVELVLEASYNSELEFGQGFEAYDQVAAEVMAGKGPDIILIQETEIDVEKLVRQGVFADMEPFFAADGFDWEPYNQAVMDGGVWGGHRYIIPLSYSFRFLLTTQTALEKTGFSVEACGDFNGFVEETTRYLEDPSQTLPLFRSPFITASSFPSLSGIQFIDYNTQTADLSAPELKTGFQWAKTVTEKNPDNFVIYDGNNLIVYTDEGGLNGAADVRDGKALWACPLLPLNAFYHEYAAMKTVDEPVMMPIRDLDGGIRAQSMYPLAVRANSENLQNAYQFIKILLSEEVQSAYNWLELSVLDSVNYDFFREIVQGHSFHVLAGVDGFHSTNNENEAIDWPTEAEFEEFMSYTREISGVYYSSGVSLYGSMQPFLYGGADYDETLEAARKRLEIYLTE